MYWQGEEESLDEVLAYSYEQANYIASQMVDEERIISLERSVCHCASV